MNIKQNIKQSWQLFKQNKLLSAVSILTTAMTITYLMVLWMGYIFNFSNIAPEDNRERTVCISSVDISEKNNDSGYRPFVYGLKMAMVEKVILPLNGAEIVRIYNDDVKPVTFSLPNKERIKLYQSITNEAVWEQFSYKFIEGRPFTREEVESGLNVVVISRSTARKLFNETENIVGREMTSEFPQKTYRVVGVVEDVSAMFTGAFAQIWMPFPNDRDMCQVDIIRKKGVSKEELEAEIIENLAKYSQADPELNYEYYEYKSSRKYDPQRLFSIISFCLLIVPAISGMGLTASSISERTSEIGIRKTYGATKNSLVRQLLSENIISTGIGAVIGLICSILLVFIFGEILLSPLSDKSRELYSLPFSTLFNIRVFGLAVLFCFIFNIMSVYIPARRAARTPIAVAVKGGEL